MSDETIELAKNFDFKKLDMPAMFQEKLDGVPVRIIRQDGKAVPYTRQGEVLKSIPHILPYVAMMTREGGSITGELYIEGMPFKDLSGHVRRFCRNDKLVMHIFDADVTNNPGLSYEVRRMQVHGMIQKLADYTGLGKENLPIRMIPGHIVSSLTEIEESFEALMSQKPKAEGAFLHSLSKPFQPGKRCWGSQRMKPVPTIDLKVINFLEARKPTGEGLGMVGRIEVEFTRLHNGTPRMTHIGIGPGAMDHATRKKVWNRQKQYLGKIIEVKYMRDDTYEALRQPTFVRFREDKYKGDVYG